MRYVKCDKCGKDIAGMKKYILYKVSETKGEHRNSKQEAVYRLCSNCGYMLYKEKKRWDELKLERDILYPKVLKWYNDYPQVVKYFRENPEEINEKAEKFKDAPEVIDSAIKTKKHLTVFTPDYEYRVKGINRNLNSIKWDLESIEKFLVHEKTLSHIKVLNEPQKTQLDESLRYLQEKIKSQVNTIKTIRKAIKEELL